MDNLVHVTGVIFRADRTSSDDEGNSRLVNKVGIRLGLQLLPKPDDIGKLARHLDQRWGAVHMTSENLHAIWTKDGEQVTEIALA